MSAQPAAPAPLNSHASALRPRLPCRPVCAGRAVHAGPGPHGATRVGGGAVQRRGGAAGRRLGQPLVRGPGLFVWGTGCSVCFMAYMVEWADCLVSKPLVVRGCCLLLLFAPSHHHPHPPPHAPPLVPSLPPSLRYDAATGAQTPAKAKLKTSVSRAREIATRMKLAVMTCCDP